MNTDTYIVRCELCEREIEYYMDTGEPAYDEGCSDLSCPLVLSSTQSDGDPEPLDFTVDDEGC